MVIEETVTDDVRHRFDGIGGDNKEYQKKVYCLKRKKERKQT